MNDQITCPMCGHRFDPSVHITCNTCPLHDGCAMVCCPLCGYTTIDPSQSGLAKWVSSMISRKKTDETSST